MFLDLQGLSGLVIEVLRGVLADFMESLSGVDRGLERML